MATPKVYVICDQNCKFEGLTKEQILTAIVQAIKSGTIGDVDTGFVTTIQTINGQPLRFFVGSQADYNALSDDDKKHLFALITNDTTKDGLLQTLQTLENSIKTLQNQLASHATENAEAAKTYLKRGNESDYKDYDDTFTGLIPDFDGMIGGGVIAFRVVATVGSVESCATVICDVCRTSVSQVFAIETNDVTGSGQSLKMLRLKFTESNNVAGIYAVGLDWLNEVADFAADSLDGLRDGMGIKIYYKYLSAAYETEEAAAASETEAAE